jgi:hypothetical protein
MARVSAKSIDRQKYWEDSISRAKQVRKTWKDRFKVDLGKEYFEGKQNPGYPDAEWITINKIYSHIKATLPSLYNNDPYFYVRLKRSFSPNPLDIALWEKRGKIRQAYLNYLKDELELKQKARLSIQDGHFSYGVIKTHFSAEIKENPDAGNPIIGADQMPMFDDSGAVMMEPETIPVNEKYHITRIHPDDFLWDEDAGPLSDSWKWLAQCIRMTYEDASKDSRIPKAALAKIKNRDTGITKDDEYQARQTRKKGDIKGRSEQSTFSSSSDEKKADELLEFWEIYELKKKTWSLIVIGGETPIIDDEALPNGIEGHPFSILRFTYRDDSPYPIPPISQGLDPQREYNLSRSQLLTHRKRFNRKYLATGPWDDAELTKLEVGDDGAIIKGTPGVAITPIADAPLDQQRQIEIGYLNRDMIELLGGSTDESRGIAGADSATQAGILEKRLEVKEGDSMSQVTDFVKSIARKLDQLVEANISRDEAVRVTGPEGELWEIVRSDDYQQINGEYEYDVNVGSTIPLMPQMERASWQAFLGLLATFPHLLTQKHLLTRMAEMHHIEDESMINDLVELGQKIMGGQVPMPGKPGSQPGVGESRPVSAMGGQAGGPMSIPQSTGE